MIWLNKLRMCSRSRTPVPSTTLALPFSAHSMFCPCQPCPYCILRVQHDTSFDEVEVVVRERMIELAVDGCSCFQIMFVVFAFEWIKKQNDEQRPFVPQVGVGRICKAPSYVVVDFAHYCTHVTKHLVERFELPPPPPPPPGLPSSSSWRPSTRCVFEGGSVGSSSSVRDSAVKRAGRAVKPLRSVSTDPVLVHPHFQWQAGGKSNKQWRSFEEPYQTQLRNAYNNSQPTYTINWDDEMEHPDTLVDFQDMTQTNMDSDYEKKIRIKDP